MALCEGCGSEFANLSDKHCHHCSARQQGLENEILSWPLCMGCGSAYQYLHGTMCGRCQKSQTDELSPNNPGLEIGLDARLSYARSQSVNPRTHGKGGNTFVNPYSVQETSQDSVSNGRREQALNLLTHMKNGYALATEGSSERLIARPKLKKKVNDNTAGCSRPVMIINVCVKEIQSRHEKPRNAKITSYTPEIKPYAEDTPWSAILDDIFDLIKSIYTAQFEHQVQSIQDFELVYSQSLVKILGVQDRATIGNIWAASIKQPKLCVPEKDINLRILNLVAKVNYPVYGGQGMDPNYDSVPRRMTSLSTSFIGRQSNKRRSSTSVDTQFQHSGLNPARRKLKLAGEMSGAQAYESRLGPAIQETVHSVHRLTCSIENGTVQWAESSEEYVAYIENEAFASGKTKHAYKLRLDDIYYVAKLFYNTTNDTPNTTGLYAVGKIENKKHVKDELIRQHLAQICLTKFRAEAASRKVSIYDIKIAQGFILIVNTPGENRDRCWIVDKYLKAIEERKFSGTQQAGAGKDLAGRTCDALAHFSLYDSNNTFVLVDIQGIITPVMKATGEEMRCKELILFDLMAHSADQSKGLGDDGINGIKEFMTQHVCNDICQQLGLPKPKTSELFLEGQDSDSDNGLVDYSSSVSQV